MNKTKTIPNIQLYIIQSTDYPAKGGTKSALARDTYELFYFDFGWISLGKQVADKNYITYPGVPDNALLLLRDLSKGREERIFLYREGKQVWL